MGFYDAIGIPDNVLPIAKVPKSHQKMFTSIQNGMIQSIFKLDRAIFNPEDSMYVMLYLLESERVRKTKISLLGSLSIKNILNDIGWSKHAKPRFKKALRGLKELGFIDIEVINNNEILISLDAKKYRKEA